MSVTIRLRSIGWFATGIAITLVLVAMFVITQQLASATKTSGERPVFVPITPCRLVDTRPAPATIGSKKTPLGPGATMTIAGRSPSGNCGGGIIPNDATALTLNVTAVGATQQTNLRVYPDGSSLPLVSNLNPAPGAAPTPNAVTTGLSGSGQFTVYNAVGSVNVIIDVAGYFVDHNHDDRYDTKAQVSAKISTASEAIIGGGFGIPGPFVVQGAFFAGLDETTFTSQPGQLEVTRFVEVRLNCSSGSRWYFLTVDGAPIRSSAIQVVGGVSMQFTGTTDAVVPAGLHVIGVRGQCVTAAAYVGSGDTYASVATTSVTVIP